MNHLAPIMLTVCCLFFIARAEADIPLIAKKRTEKDAKVCVDHASKSAYKFLGLNSTWRKAYNECLREKLNEVARIHIRDSLKLTKLELECEKAGIQVSEAGQTLSVDIIHIMAKASDTTLQKQRTSIEMEQNIEEFYKKILTSRQNIKKLSKQLKK